MPNNNDPKKKKNPFDDFGAGFPNDFSNFFKNIQRIIEDMLNNGDFSDFEKFFEENGDKIPFVWGFSFNRAQMVNLDLTNLVISLSEWVLTRLLLLKRMSEFVNL